MSDEKIDHAATAVAHNHEAMARRGFWASWRWQRSAQVHATLALVEQQRIANIIALGTEYAWGLGESEDYFAQLRPEIRKGLGL